jgi:hypothetical protein
MDIRNRKLADKGDPLGIDALTLHPVPAERIWSVQHNKLLPLFGARLKAFAHGADVGVTTATNILHIINQHIDSLEHSRGWFSGITVEGVSRKTSQGIAS